MPDWDARVRRTYATVRWGRRVGIVSGVATLGWLAGWCTVLPDNKHTMAVYFTLLLATFTCVIVVALATNQLAIHRAFAAGVATGRRDSQPPPKHRGTSNGLRLVD